MARPRFQAGQLRWAGVLGHGHQDLRHIELHRPCGEFGFFLGHEPVQVLLADPHPPIDLALSKTSEQQLIAQILTKALKAQSFAGHAQAQVGHADLVLASHIFCGLVHGFIRDANATLARGLELGALRNQALEHRTRKFRTGRHGPTLHGQLRHQALHAADHLLVGDGLGIDHGDNEVGRPYAGRHLGLSLTLSQRRPGQAGRAAQRGKACPVHEGQGEGKRKGRLIHSW